MYINNFEYKTQNGSASLTSLNKVFNAEGYVDEFANNTSYSGFCYYRTDHLGNVCEVWRAGIPGGALAATLQKTFYFPSGLPLSYSTSPGLQPNKYNNKPFIEMHGFDTYDFSARMMYPAIGDRFMSIDPLCEKYYSISPYAYCAGNPVRYVDPDGRVIVDAKGKPITHSAKTGWPSNVTADVRRIGTAMMATPKGTIMFNKMTNASHNITITIDAGKGDGTRNGYASTTKSGNNIGSADIVIFEGMAEQTVNKIKTVNIALDNGATLTNTPGAETQALLDNPPMNADEQMANVAAHEAEHATNKAANAHFEPSKAKRETIANQIQIEVIKQTPDFRLEILEPKPAVIIP